MKILYITNVRIPTEKAHGIQIIKMCEAFSNYNIKVELVLPTRKNIKFKDINLFKYYSIKENFKLKKIFSYDPYFLIKLPQGIYIKFQALFFITSLFLFLLFKKNKKGYIFYTRDEYLLPILQLFSKKVVWEGHSLSKNKKIYTKYFKKCYRIIVLTSYIKNELIDLGVDKNNILVSPDGVDLDIFDIDITKKEAREKLNLPQNKKIVMYTGHLYKWKGVYVLLEASKNIPEVLFYFVGGTDYDIKKFKKYIKTDNIILLGNKPHTDIPYYLKSSDILVLPNSGKEKISSHYTSPIKLFEYMASKRPMVASDLPSIKEILNDTNSILVESDNPLLLSKGINKILNNKEISDKISEQAYKDVKTHSWRMRANGIINFINNLIINNKFWNKYTSDMLFTSFSIDLLKKYANGNVLDLGCGNGVHANSVKNLFKCNVYGIDPSDDSIKKAKKRNSNIDFKVASAYDLPFENNFFNLVYSIDVIEHLKKPEKMLEEVGRVLKSGGCLIIQTPNYPIKRLYDFYNLISKNWRKSFKDDPTHFYKFTALSLKKMCSKYFEVIEFKTRNIFLEKKLKFLKKKKNKMPWILFGQKTIIILKK